MMHKKRARLVGIGALSAGILGLLSVPVMAEVDRLTSLPLGKGAATISWTGSNGIRPSIGPIKGSARGLVIVATGVVPKQPRISSSQGSTSISIPSTLPLADIKGTIDGTSFALNITLDLSNLNLNSTAVQTFGTVTGSFHGQAVHATLTGNPSSSLTQFSGTIGVDHVTGTIGQAIHHGTTTTAHATFDVTK